MFKRPLLCLVTLVVPVALMFSVATTGLTQTTPPSVVPTRPLPNPLYGLTVDDISNIADIIASASQLPKMPTIRIYFDVHESASYYASAVAQLHPHSYIMGELLDSSDETSISTAAFTKRVASYLSKLGSNVDVWEIGNEVNGNWLGSYSTVSAKLTNAYNAVSAAGGRTALTLYYNIGCGNGPSELDLITFTKQHVPASVRTGLNYILLSYYGTDCRNKRPSVTTWTSYFQQLHALYPNALLGFSEVGLDDAATHSTLSQAASIMNYYYSLPITLPYYIGFYGWWDGAEDLVPATQPLFPIFIRALEAEDAVLTQW